MGKRIAIILLSIVCLLIIYGLCSFVGQIFTLMVDLPPAPPEAYWTATPLPTATPIDSAIKEMWSEWNNLKIITSEPNKTCIILANSKARISGTIINDNNFDLINIQIKGFSCPLGTPLIFGNKPYLSSDENKINYLEKMVTHFHCLF